MTNSNGNRRSSRTLKKLVFRYSTQVAEQTQLIPIVPTRNNLAASKLLNADTIHADTPVRRRNTEEACGVGHRHRPASYNSVILFDRLVNVDVYIRECGAEATPKLLEVVSSVNICSVLGLAIPDDILGAHFIYGFFAALVPDIFKPFANERCVFSHVNALLKG